MITKIVEQLKTGSIKAVVPYGTKDLPDPPYVVVKPVKDPLNRGRLYRIIPHFLPGQNIFLEDYLFNELSDLLEGFATESRHGNYNSLLTENDYTDIVDSNNDKTINMERMFLVPSRIF